MRLQPDNLDSEERAMPACCRFVTGSSSVAPTASYKLAALSGRGRSVVVRAFTLIEMLVVLAIIGLLAALTLPHIRGHSESVAIDAAARQLMDDISYARLRAISQRGTVAIVFIGPEVQTFFPGPTIGNYKANEIATINRLHGGVYTHYALYEYRKAGEQPGILGGQPGDSFKHGYITEWKSLPEKTFIDPEMFNYSPGSTSFQQNGARFPFPLSSSPHVDGLPYIAFDLEGRSIEIDKRETGAGKPTRDIYIRLARGSILYSRETSVDPVINGSILPANYDVQQIPPGNATNTVIRIDLLTGRAQRIEPQLP